MTFDFMAFDLIDWLFPRHCSNCSTPWAYLCKNCKKHLEPHPEICPVCHRFSQDYQKCINCKSNKDFVLEGIIIPFSYTNILKKLIMKLKYFHKKDIGGFLIDRLALALEANKTFQKQIQWSNTIFWNHLTKSSEIITFVPTHRYRHYFIKGYNQSELLAKKLGEKLHVPVISIAKKKKHTKTQASLDRNGRLKNLKNVFSLIPHLTLLGNETILIVDDVTTTWSTINELAKLIKFHYPNIKVRWAVLGRHVG